MIEKIWRSIDPDFFTVIEDLLEDTIQSVAPSFIVRITFFKIDILIFLMYTDLSKTVEKR